MLQDRLEQPGKKEEKKRLLCWCCVVREESDKEDEKIRFYFSKILKNKNI